MPYKTISLKLKKPSKWKRDAINQAMSDYSLALEIVLRAVKKKLPKTGTLSRTACLRLFDGEVMQSVEHLSVEPFKDSIKLEAYSILRDYLQKSQKLRRPRRYPSIMATHGDLQDYFIGEKLNFYELNRLLDKYEKIEPLFFCRNSPNRDFSLLQDYKTGAYYAKLYLFNRENALPCQRSEDSRLRYVNGTKELLIKKRKKIRYILAPLDLGQWQLRHLKAVEEGEAVLKSAILLRKKHTYFLNIKLWYEEQEKAETQTYLGVVRGLSGSIYVVAVDSGGSILDEASIDEGGSEAERLNRLANRIITLAQRNNSQIVLENLIEYQDKLRTPAVAPAISRTEYNALVPLVIHKAGFTALPEPIRLSPRFIFYRCTNCGEIKNSNRMDKVLLCLSCGSSMTIERTGAYNLASAPMLYKRSKLKVLREVRNNEAHFSISVIGYIFSCKNNHLAEDLFVNNLTKFIADPPEHLSQKQLGILQTLRKRSDLKDSLLFVEKSIK